ANELVGREMVGTLRPAFVTFGHAVQAALVAPVGDGDAQVVDGASEGILHVRRRVESEWDERTGERTGRSIKQDERQRARAVEIDSIGRPPKAQKHKTRIPDFVPCVRLWLRINSFYLVGVVAATAGRGG